MSFFLVNNLHMLVHLLGIVVFDLVL